jgi:uncharacterized protein (TIGR03435 family)
MQSRLVVAFITMLLALVQTNLQFEVASIRPSDLGNLNIAAGIRAGVRLDGAQVRYTLVPLIAYVGYAYQIRNYQIVGPDWLRSELFDIVAKLPEGSTTKQVPQMLRALLADRFKLKVHRETKEFPVYVLEVAKSGLKMTELPPDPATAVDLTNPLNVSFTADRTGGTFSLGGGAYFTAGTSGVEGKKLSMAALTYMLTPFLDRPAIDATGLKGIYDFVLKISPEDLMAMQVRSAINAGVSLPPQALRALDNASGDSLGAALDRLGLTLVSRKAPLEVIVVDAMEKAPTEN